MTELYQFGSYKAYTAFQKKKAAKTQSRTQRKDKHYAIVAKELRTAYPELNSVLCVGCREDTEIDTFKDAGYDVSGIDLLDDGKVIGCDMSKIPEHPWFHNRKVDIMFCCHSLEHCLDFEGFLNGVEYLNAQVIRIECPIVKKIRKWDCAYYEFMDPEVTDYKEREAGILKLFPLFQLDKLSVEEGNILITIRRK